MEKAWEQEMGSHTESMVRKHRENRKQGLPGSKTSRHGPSGQLFPTRLRLLKVEQSSQTLSPAENQEFEHRKATPMKSHQHGYLNKI